MCLAVPARLVECRDDAAVADLHGNRVNISTMLVPAAKIGDWVLLHAGFAIQLISEQEAQATFAIINDIRAASGGET